MTETEIERRVEKMVDHLDRVFLSGQMTQADYDAAIRELDQWAEGQAWKASQWRFPTFNSRPLD